MSHLLLFWAYGSPGKVTTTEFTYDPKNVLMFNDWISLIPDFSVKVSSPWNGRQYKD